MGGGCDKQPLNGNFGGWVSKAKLPSVGRGGVNFFWNYIIEGNLECLGKL